MTEPATDQDFAAARKAMVASQLRTNAVTDAGVLAAMGRVPREAFVGPGQQPVAYIDRALPLGGGRQLNPILATARLLDAARPRPGERALVIGAATGYSVAVLADIGLAVTAVESDPALVAQARGALHHAATAVDEGPLAEGHAGGGPYDLILIDGAVEEVPQAIVDQLVDGGRLATGIVERGVTRLALGRKSGSAFGLFPFADSEAVVLPGFAKVRAFSF
ncbi:protein-L-isoaspartate O-methyltransferase family protein [Sphingomonas quercus]|uniref:Protein-L-isoaspartate O-methyltransferase n=1 Tax=Sphingomonas quercus TaxID=2842451 RepID=A0ABS6BEU0_9SPHN|nr:protein-L-isoaspartate O-methyltransferase [Sphingomonas quercus]MBU3076347.1 protein-L-isoaspartate O-methyltransferase [Sphingomonas quercus]